MPYSSFNVTLTPSVIPQPSMNANTLLDPSRFERGDTCVLHEPFPFMIAHAQLPDEARAALTRDFPRYAGAGYFPYDSADCGPAINALVERLTSPEVADAIGQRLGIDRLDRYPPLVTLCRSLNKRHGTIHTDSRSKMATALLYLNSEWPDSSAGCLRFLHKLDDIDAVIVPELKPLYGEFAVFKRCDNSWHGHLPFAGERRVIQVAWIVDEQERQRKIGRGRFSRAMKKLFGSLDRRLGAGRDRNAGHWD